MRSRLVEVGKDLTAGTMAGIAQLLVGHPFDTVKVKLQSQMASSQLPKYSGAWDALKKIMASEGPKGLYRGLGAPLAAVALFNAVLFTARGQMEVLLSHNKKQPYTPLSVRQQMVAGMGAGVAVSFVACPTELIKCRLQAQGSVTAADAAPPPPPPPVRNLLELDPLTLVEEDKPPEIADDQDTERRAPPEAGIISNPACETLNVQEDIGLRTLVIDHSTPEQQQQQHEQSVVDSEAPAQVQPSKYSGSMDVAVQIFRSEGGFVGFFKGMSPTFLREVLGNAAYFGSYQGTKQLLSKGGAGEDLSTGSLLVAGGVAGAMFWLCVYPADVIKSMMQVDDHHNPKYKGVVDAFRKVFKAQGMKGLYCGFGPAMARSVLANAVCFYVYELVRKAFK